MLCASAIDLPVNCDGIDSESCWVVPNIAIQACRVPGQSSHVEVHVSVHVLGV